MLLGKAEFDDEIENTSFEGSPMALETLIEPRTRDNTTRALIERFIGELRAADIPDADRESLLGSLENLKVESFRQAGRELASTLGEQTYGGGEPHALFQPLL